MTTNQQKITDRLNNIIDSAKNPIPPKDDCGLVTVPLSEKDIEVLEFCAALVRNYYADKAVDEAFNKIERCYMIGAVEINADNYSDKSMKDICKSIFEVN